MHTHTHLQVLLEVSQRALQLLRVQLGAKGGVPGQTGARVRSMPDIAYQPC